MSLMDDLKNKNGNRDPNPEPMPKVDGKSADKVSDIQKPPEASQLESRKPEPTPVRSEPEEYLWSSKLYPNYSIHLSSETVKAEKGLLRLTKHQHEEVKTLIRKGRGDIAGAIQFIDVEAAYKVAEAELASMKRNRPQATRGATHSQATAETYREVNPEVPEGSDPRREAAMRAQREHVLAPVEEVEYIPVETGGEENME